MKKTIIAIMLLNSLTAFSQWKYEKVNNGLDDPYKISYNSATVGNGTLKLENRDECDISFYLSSTYICDDSPTADIAFTVNGAFKKYTISCTTSEDKRTAFFGTISGDMLKDLLNSSSVKIRINESHCTDNYYQFNMSGSKLAYKFMTSGCAAQKFKEQRLKFIQDSLLDVEFERNFAYNKKQDSIKLIEQRIAKTKDSLLLIDALKNPIYKTLKYKQIVYINNNVTGLVSCVLNENDKILIIKAYDGKIVARDNLLYIKCNDCVGYIIAFDGLSSPIFKENIKF